MNKLWIALLVLVLQACGGGGGDTSASTSTAGTPQSCSIADQRQQVLSFMTNEYYWYQQMGTPDNNAATMDAYFQSLLYKPTDRFSYTEPTSSFNQLFQEGTFTGYGYSLTVTDPNVPTLRVRDVEPKGPAYAAGLRRGDTIITINGFSPAQILAGSAGSVTSAGIQRTWVVRDVAGTTKTISATSATFPLSVVRNVEVLNAVGPQGQPVKVGYLDYTQFVTYSVSDLTAAVQAFVAQGATELVLDLRYNGGGDIATSRDLASMIGGAQTAGKLFAQLRYNDKNQSRNQDYSFTSPSPSMNNLSRVFVIVTDSTASASELVINGLKPFMNVVLVGSTTYGKPFGFEPFSYCGTTYNAVNFSVFNSLGQGGYTTGFTPTCPVADDLDHPLGDPNELDLKTALGYISTNSCPQTAQSAPLSGASLMPAMARSPQVLGEVVRPGMFRR